MSDRVNDPGFDEVVIVEVDEDEVGYEILSDEELKEAVQYLQEEYYEAESEIVERKIKWDKWRRQRQARPEQESKNFPWPNASNVSVPLTRINLQTLFGKLKSAFMSKDPMWKITAYKGKDEQERKMADVVTRYFDVLSKSPTDLNMKQKGNTIFMEGGLLGFQWVKTVWSSVKRNFVIVEDGMEKEVTSTIHQGPDLVVCPPEDILYKHTWGDVNHIPVLFHDIHLPWHIVRQKGDEGIYENVDELEAQGRDAGNRTEEERAERLGTNLSQESVWDITEAYFYWEVEGRLSYLILTLHIPSGIVLKQQYNTLGFLPFEPLVFIHEPYVLEGTGVGLACEAMQDEIDAIHNMRNDNMKIANMRMFAAKRGGSVKPNERLFPGKILFLDNPKEDLQPVQLGEVYPSSLQSENMTIMYGQKSTGMNDPMSGFSDQTMGSRDTFRGQHLRLQQGHGILNSVMENMVEGFGNVARKLFYIMVQNRDMVVADERTRGRLEDKDIDLLEMALSIPYDQVPFRLNFSIKVSDVEQTFEGRRQNMLALTQLYAQYSSQIMPLVFQLYGPEGQVMQQQAPDLYQHMMAIYVGATKLIKDIFLLFGEEDAEDYVPDTSKAELMQDMMRRLNDIMVGMNQGGLNAAGQNQRGGVSGGQVVPGGGTGIPGGGLPGGIAPGQGGQENPGGAGL